MYTREGRPSDKDIEAYDLKEFTELIDEEGNVINIYIIDKETANGKENTYIYDEKTDTVFKIPATSIGGKVYHSYECATLGKGGEQVKDEELSDQIVEKESNVMQVENEYYYAPNMKGFNAQNSYLIYYSDNFAIQKEIPLYEYMEKEEPYKLEEDGKTYTLHNYGKKIWANVKTMAHRQEAWWVWIPRYAYKIEEKNMNVIYIGLDNQPLNKELYPDGLPEGYIPHPAFTVDGDELKGIWMSKYDASYTDLKAENTDNVLKPNMQGFDEQNTYIELYDKSTNSFKEEVPLSEANLDTINNDKRWYDYQNKIWANIKTYAHNQEAWWVWIPRFAYSIPTQKYLQRDGIIFVDLNNEPINKEAYPEGLPKDYIVHPAFTVDGEKLSGIWMSKYDPSYTSTNVVNADNVLKPNMEGFDEQNTYIELYDKSTNSFTEEVPLSEANLDTINDDKKWYDYQNKIWANIKTYAHNQEAWWVWIPRYAYNIPTQKYLQQEGVIFVDINNEPINKEAYPEGLPKDYIVHPAFTVDGEELSGIWMSKYYPSYVQ